MAPDLIGYKLLPLAHLLEVRMMLPRLSCYQGHAADNTVKERRDCWDGVERTKHEPEGRRVT
jgi:hypothetical protein